MLDYSQSYVSRIEKKALRKIKNYLKGITHEEIEFTTEIKPNIKDKTKKKILEVANTFLKENLTFKELAKI